MSTNNGEVEIKIPSIVRKWARCTKCKSKAVIYDNTAECHGVFIKCQRGCKREFELVIHNGQQIIGGSRSGAGKGENQADADALSTAT